MTASEIEDFEEILEEAECEASTDWEMGFVSNMKEKYDQYGDETFVSESQLETLEKIARLK